MPSARAAPPLRVEFAVSKRFVCLLSAGHVGALVIGLLSTSTPLAAVLCPVTLVSWLWTIHRYALLRSPRALVALELQGERTCVLRRRDGRSLHGHLRGSSYVLPWLVVLHVAVNERMVDPRVALFADSMTQDAHRRLRVRLRWARYDDNDFDRPDPPL